MLSSRSQLIPFSVDRESFLSSGLSVSTLFVAKGLSGSVEGTPVSRGVEDTLAEGLDLHVGAVPLRCARVMQ